MAPRPVAVLDANCLVPPGLRDVLLSCADAKLFRPVWQEEIEAEVHRNGKKLLVRKGVSGPVAQARMDRTLGQMNIAFPDARLPSPDWVPLVPDMINHIKDRHVLAAAVGAGASHLVTSNLRDFPLRSRPPGLQVVTPDSFLVELLADDVLGVIRAVETLATRLRRPPNTPLSLADAMASGGNAQVFGVALGAALRVQGVQ